MKYSLTVRKEAELDISRCFNFYEEHRLGLGHDFLLCVDAVISKIERNPLLYKKVYKDLRRVPIERFPYRIFYFVPSEHIIVTAVFHAHKDPLSWEDRT
ncbi:MAG: type II toxin-antitoxin system RelE/ParE family toxin [gamma proteobacterium symbiont of Bathyaustriella thionipta]|nr:type II toxin-antitoxin system RelE/ParE family toxin [gamma proteobacterium symbiont of Bathyaustriella thionipta]MCU7950981.1 type II toxin-antitoxin system RelE/ParE family toxin [gamma proteobacterium symbiont of Bathyaustriella thionipta]MCU7952097.1 type II toxin-antitoxin system RelE/ParE family toxin [gamma proteobacterium symbiont of Bathyaustriella thionipta]MCU7957483.1 type II toxin-antitoxin system RelE/ParE family toxin [gamma proteobacterium symbiont of Bathyaustriella thionipt